MSSSESLLNNEQLEELKVIELRKIAKSKGIICYSNLNKKDLIIEAIKEQNVVDEEKGKSFNQILKNKIKNVLDEDIIPDLSNIIAEFANLKITKLSDIDRDYYFKNAFDYLRNMKGGSQKFNKILNTIGTVKKGLAKKFPDSIDEIYYYGMFSRPFAEIGYVIGKLYNEKYFSFYYEIHHGAGIRPKLTLANSYDDLINFGIEENVKKLIQGEPQKTGTLCLTL
ncbi:MAG: hypothetical protein Sylvanvirus27_9 [Sylvanvirus sp.]|uniref:Rho termination factor-like N-terminal domain-containing protein n=1 Tax=Sylvanvirus sp. TaxID=2487774 RepID=A0A3G5AIV7_9VIRU|nr:MAG: hypothetical protein Sylvanvirus27_9 [Sylvanvirus sp.]